MIKHIFRLLWNKRKANGLMILEIFLSFLVLYLLLSFIFINLGKYKTPLGFATEDRWMIRQSYSRDSTTLAQNNILLEDALGQLDRVKSVAFSGSCSPFSGYTWQSTNDHFGFEIQYKIVEANEDYAETMSIPVIQGRWFEEGDLNQKYTPIVVTKDYIDKYFPGKNMIDSIGLVENVFPEGTREYKIIGVTEEYKYEGEFAESYPKVFRYLPKEDEQSTVIYLDVEKGTPATYEKQVNDVLTSITKSSSNVILNVETMRYRNSRETWIPIIAMLIICGFLGINVALGFFGVLWYNIQKRKSEIGLRRAVGAHTGEIGFQFVMEMILLAVIGIVAGLFFAVQLPILKVFPFDAKYFYYSMVVSAIFMLLLVIICALYPSRQAANINPAIALHED